MRSRTRRDSTGDIRGEFLTLTTSPGICDICYHPEAGCQGEGA